MWWPRLLNVRLNSYSHFRQIIHIYLYTTLPIPPPVQHAMRCRREEVHLSFETWQREQFLLITIWYDVFSCTDQLTYDLNS